MQRLLKRLYMTGFLVAAVVALMAASMMQPLFGTQADFSVYNTRWNGASGFGSEVARVGDVAPTFSIQPDEEGLHIVHRSFVAFDVDPQRSSVVLLGPDAPPQPGEISWLREFLNGGGRLLLGDDFGQGQAFLDGLGVGTKIWGYPLMDLAFLKRPDFIVASQFTPHTTTFGVESVILNHPTALDLSDNATALAQTTSSSWLEAIEDGVPTLAEPLGPFTWLAEEPYGQGTILLLADPSALTNGNAKLGDNEAFIRQVAAWLTADGRTVLIDESHRNYPDPVRLRATLVGDVSPTTQGVLAGLALLTVVAYATGWAERSWTWLAGRSRRTIDRLLADDAADERDLVERTAAKHPEWDETVLRRILVGWDERP